MWHVYVHVCVSRVHVWRSRIASPAALTLMNFLTSAVFCRPSTGFRGSWFHFPSPNRGAVITDMGPLAQHLLELQRFEFRTTPLYQITWAIAPAYKDACIDDFLTDNLAFQFHSVSYPSNPYYIKIQKWLFKNKWSCKWSQNQENLIQMSQS